MYEPEIAQWTPAAMALPNDGTRKSPNIPRSVYLREAVSFAKRIETYWGSPGPGIPALGTNHTKFELVIKDEILSLQKGVRGTDTRWVYIVDPKRPVGLIEEGIEIRAELMAALGFTLDDGIQELADDQFAKIKAIYKDDDDNIANLADQLIKIAAFAKTQTAKLATLEEDFDMSLLDRAVVVAEQLAALPVVPIVVSPESQAALDLRNRFLHLLIERIELVRHVVKWKYRKHPGIAEQFESPYERRRNNLLRRRKRNEEKKREEEALQKEIARKKAEIRAKLLEEQLTAEVREELAREKRAREKK